jgi:hypothetical protein
VKLGTLVNELASRGWMEVTPQLMGRSVRVTPQLMGRSVRTLG